MRSWLVLLACAACNVPEPPGSTGGTDEPLGPCGRGFSVISSDFLSSNVSLVALDGRVLSSSFVSSATPSVALSAAISNDVVFPTSPQLGDDIVLIDRFGTDVLTWVTVADAGVSQQLSLSEKTNPHDIVVVNEHKAYVTRFDPGGPHEGNDVAIIDPSVPRALGRISLDPAMAGEDPRFLARPSRAVLVGGKLIVALEAYTLSFDDSASSRVVAIDPATDTILETLVLDGLEGCDGLAVAADDDRIALSCLGSFGGTLVATLEQSGVVVLGTAGGLREIARFPAADLADSPLGYGLAFASPNLLLGISSGFDAEASIASTAFELDLETGQVRSVAESAPVGGGEGGIVDVQCAADCGVCAVADSFRGVLTHYALDQGRLARGRDIRVDENIGLPPQRLGRF
jgi:hypothetical protein